MDNLFSYHPMNKLICFNSIPVLLSIYQLWMCVSELIYKDHLGKEERRTCILGFNSKRTVFIWKASQQLTLEIHTKHMLFFFKLYITVLVLPNIKMNPSQVYMCSPSWRVSYSTDIHVPFSRLLFQFSEALGSWDLITLLAVWLVTVHRVAESDRT